MLLRPPFVTDLERCVSVDVACDYLDGSLASPFLALDAAGYKSFRQLDAVRARMPYQCGCGDVWIQGH